MSESTPAPAGFEFVVSDRVPRQLGVRRLSRRTFEVHPDLLAVLEHWPQFCQAVLVLGAACAAFSRSVARLAERCSAGRDPEGEGGGLPG
jgi:hypothetical protein